MACTPHFPRYLQLVIAGNNPRSVTMGDIHNRSQAVFIVTCTVTAVSFVIVATRLVSRVRIFHTLTPDDCIILVAWLFACGMSSAICCATLNGLGMHGRAISTSSEPVLRRLVYSADVLYNPGILATKTSILIQYSRLFSSKTIFRRANYTVMVVVILGGLALTLVNAFQCWPPQQAFDPLKATETNEKCTSVLTIYLSSAPLNIITDVAILLLPMPIFRNLYTARKQKLILVVTFGFGLFATIIGIVRVAYLQHAASDELHSNNTTNYDTHASGSSFYWYAALSFMWSAVEVNVGIMCACVPALKPLFVKFLPRLVTSASQPHEIDPGAEWNNGDKPATHPLPGGIATDSRRIVLPEDDELPLNRSRQSQQHRVGPHYRQSILADRTRWTFSDAFSFAVPRSSKSLLQLSNAESVGPLLTFTVLFFIWGLEYGWLDALNHQFQVAAGMTLKQTSALHSAYYAGYLAGPLCIGYFTLQHWGFKITAIAGLAIYACGALMFWPAAVLTSFPACFITNFVVGFGLSNLEVSANSFVILCGPSKYGAARLCFSQACQAVGSVIASVIASSTFARPEDVGVPSLVGSQWLYLGMSFFTIFLAIVFFLIPLPDAGLDEFRGGDLQHISKRLRVPLHTFVPVLGVLAQFCYVGGQEVNETLFGPYVSHIGSTSLNATSYTYVAHAAFAASRFLASGLAIIYPPRLILLFFTLGAVLFEVLAMQRIWPGSTSIAMLVVVFFMEGPIFPLTFTLTLQQMGRRTGLVAVAVTSAIGGGACFAPIAVSVQQGRPGGAFYALCVAIGPLATCSLLPLVLNFVPSAQSWCDGVMRSPTSPPGIGSLAPAGPIELKFNIKAVHSKRTSGRGIIRDITVDQVEHRVDANGHFTLSS
jgi:fucose permease